MPASDLTAEARRENAAALAAAIGVGLDEANEAFNLTIFVNASPDDAVGNLLAEEVVNLLSRTVRDVVRDTPPAPIAAELVIGDAEPQTDAPRVHVALSNDRVVIGSVATATAGSLTELPRILILLAACYASGNVLRRALGSACPFDPPDPFLLDFGELGLPLDSLMATIDLGHAYLAGAGAIGNGFLWAARFLNLRGTLEIADDDVVSSGNLNRQVWFHTADIGLGKAVRLAGLAQPELPGLTLIPRDCRLQELRGDGPWLRRLIVAVDSRLARRALQNEFPGEVFDASTTDIREIVIHHNRQPTQGACLSCIYEPDSQEVSREQHIAEHLGVSLDEVRTSRISAAAAAVIATKFPKFRAGDLEGLAYDSLYKQLCSEGQLRTPEGRAVVAPFAFVSVLAGTLLALELVRRLGAEHHSSAFNYWRLSPWHPPSSRRQVTRPKQPGCLFCENAVLARVNTSLWG